MADYLITDTQMTAMADGIRNILKETNSMTAAQMITKLQQIKLGKSLNVVCHINEEGHWVRPQGYPNLDILYDTIGENESCVYLTYDLTKTPGYGWIGIYGLGATFYVERGHIENGSFISEFISDPISSGNVFRQTLDSENGNIQLWKVSSSGNLTVIKFAPDTGTTSNNKMNTLQPCVERVGRIPYATNLGSSESVTHNAYAFGTKWLERDKIIVGTKSVVTTLAGMYTGCNSLQETNCGDWDTSNWQVTSISSLFYLCYNIKYLDLSKWDTSKWTITSLAYAWNACYALEFLDVSTWNTSGWNPTSLEYTFYGCMSLKELNINNWDTSNWDKLNTIRGTWGLDYNLLSLDLSNWDTSKWKLTIIYNTWGSCRSLINLHIENWDTSGWTINSMAYAWSSCSSLQKLDLSRWDTSNWAVTSLESTWSGCEALKTLPIENWDVSNWAVTRLSGTWSSCSSIESFNLNSWDVSQWRPTLFSSAWSYNYALRELKIDEWDVSDWPVTDFSRNFMSCFSLEELDLTSWDVSNWQVTTIYYLFSEMYGAKKIDIHNWDVSNWALTEARYLYNSTQAETILLPEHLHGTVANSKFTTTGLYNLTNFNGIAIDINQNYSTYLKLTHESLLSIINRLPTVTETKTLTLGQTNKLKLTAAEIAVATQKGWTVA